jgi:hypothetical protein
MKWLLQDATYVRVQYYPVCCRIAGCLTGSQQLGELPLAWDFRDVSLSLFVSDTLGRAKGCFCSISCAAVYMTAPLLSLQQPRCEARRLLGLGFGPLLGMQLPAIAGMAGPMHVLSDMPLCFAMLPLMQHLRLFQVR